ncbi:MAG: O-antigen ligase family protein, partial [Victivallales bacterium]|nr:O-antigen ligase family protein [Victivallales bacterium]
TKLQCTLQNISSYRYQFIILFAAGIFILGVFNCKQKRQLAVISSLTLLFLGEITLSAYLYGSYPVVSVLKGLLYVLAFNAVLYGVFATADKINWICFLKRFFLLLYGLSIFAIPFMSLRTKNGHAFQGIFIHPNLFGIYAAVLIALLLAEIHASKVKYVVACILAVLFMQYLSESRTGLFSSLLVIGVYFIYSFKGSKKIQYVLLGLFFVSMMVLFMPDVSERIYEKSEDFIFKKAGDNLLFSRRGQIRRFAEKISASPVWGTGFMAPYDKNIKSYDLKLDAYVEQGNIFMAVTSETGFFGTVIFALIFIAIYCKGNKEYAHLFATPFIISCGEMVFFSTNSVGLTLYILLAVYCQRGLKNPKPEPCLVSEGN